MKYTRWAIGYMAAAAIAYMLFSIFSLAFSFTTATDDSAVLIRLPEVASSSEVHPGSVASFAYTAVVAFSSEMHPAPAAGCAIIGRFSQGNSPGIRGMFRGTR